MAFTQPPMFPVSDYSEKNFAYETREYHIQGKMLKVSYSMEEHNQFGVYSAVDMKTSIKRDIATRMAHYIIDSKMIEFTQQINPLSDNIMTVHGYCFIVPDSNVRILRTVP